jgi:hypothetical protein
MFITDLFENTELMNTLVVYPGRFQPWHIGHREVYNHLVGKFGRDRVFIATSNKVEPPRSPFSFTEKVQFMHFTGVPNDVIVESKDPYKVIELTSKYNPKTTRLIFAVSEKDMAEDPRFKFGYKKDGSPTYFQPMPRDASQIQSLESHAYITVVPTFKFKILGQEMEGATDIRKLFAESNEQLQRQIIIDLFGKYSPEIHSLMSNKIRLAEAFRSDKSMMALLQAKKNIEQNRQQELAAWEQDFKKNFAAKQSVLQNPTAAQQPRQIAATPSEPHSVLKARMVNLNKAIEKTNLLDTPILKSEQKGLMNPGLRADTDISLYVKDADKDNYLGLNQKLDHAINLIKQRWNTNKLAYSKPKNSNIKEEGVAEDSLNEFSLGGDDNGGGGVYVIAPETADRKKYKVQLTDVTHEQFVTIWNHVPKVYQVFFKNVYPFWNSAHPLFTQLPVKKMTSDKYILQVGAAMLGVTVSNVRAGKKAGDFGDTNIELEAYEYLPPGANSSQTRNVMNKINPTTDKFIWKRPNQIGGSFSEQDLVSKGFKKSQYNSWGGTQAMWNRLTSIGEQLNQPTPTAQQILDKHDLSVEEFMAQIRLGVKIEFEHTKDAKTAYEIALDHRNKRPDYYTVLARTGLEEAASGYIPTAAEKDDPRFKTALTVDVRPGTDKKNMRALRLIK